MSSVLVLDHVSFVFKIYFKQKTHKNMTHRTLTHYKHYNIFYKIVVTNTDNSCTDYLDKYHTKFMFSDNMELLYYFSVLYIQFIFIKL